MFDELIKRFDAAMEAQHEEPYPRDKVQALGMVFAEEWNARKSEILEVLGFAEKDFDYNKYRLWMPLLKEKLV